MRMSGFVAVLVALGSGSALAADLRPARTITPAAIVAAPTNWTGFYVGATVGGSAATALSEFSIVGLPPFASARNPMSGALGGLQAGYNWQSGPAVFGVEADIQYGNVKGSLDAPCPAGGCGALASASYGQTVSWFGTARGRIGYAADSWLIYATGGYAYARLTTEAIASAGPATAVSKWSDFRGGWTVGAGVELAIAQRWSLKFEYLYAELGRFDQTWTPAGLPAIRDSTRLDMNILRVGANYRL